MARELGLNPAKLDNHRHEPWKAPPFIEDLYAKRFGRERPDVINTIEEIARPADRHGAEPAAPRASPTRPA